MLSPNAEKIFKLKYALTLPDGRKEEWEQCAARVAEYVSRAEVNESNRLQFIADGTKLINDLSFVPGGRVLANAGTPIKNLMNCFVLPIEDSREGIYDTLKKAAEIFAWGGGIGYNFSHIRSKGQPVKTTGGKASGPVSFMELFDTTGEVISQASRRGAQMGILNCDHPDIVEFINHKSTLNNRNERIYNEYLKDHGHNNDLHKVLTDSQLTHFNISVAVTDECMSKYKQNDAWAYHLMQVIADSAWKNGDPGVYFIDRANEYSLVPYLGSLEATNPCGEIPLLPYEACCLGSLNLDSFVAGNFIDFEYLKFVVHFAVRFLDNVQELNLTPVEEVNNALKATRRLGLGVMGFADVLAEMGIPYDHKDAFTLARIFGEFIQREAWLESMELGRNRGAFPAFDENKINWKIIDGLELPHANLRNVAVTSIAPTGTIALLADVNSGIEPFFSRKYKRNITEGVGNVAKDSVIQENTKTIAKTAHEISWENHVRMQATWQKYIDNAVSKTINMPKSATTKDISDAINLAWELGCKGLTIYRNNSRGFQILET